jgi:hypothetical protein
MAYEQSPWQRLLHVAAQYVAAVVVAPVMLYVAWHSVASRPDPYSDARVWALKANVTRALGTRYGLCTGDVASHAGVEAVRLHAFTTKPADILLLVHSSEYRREKAVLDTWARQVSSDNNVNNNNNNNAATFDFFFFGAPITQASTHHAHPGRRAYRHAKTTQTTPSEVKKGEAWRKTAAALVQAYDDYPTKRWFVKADDNSHVDLTALLMLLSGFDADRRQYLGYPMYALQSRGDDADATFNFNFAFAHGGAGYVVSRETVRVMLENGLRDASTTTELANDEGVSVADFLRNMDRPVLVTPVEGLFAYPPNRIAVMAAAAGTGGDDDAPAHVRSQVVFSPLPPSAKCRAVSHHHISPARMYAMHEAVFIQATGHAPRAATDDLHRTWRAQRFFARYGDLHADVLRQMRGQHVLLLEHDLNDLHAEAYVIYDVQAATTLDEWTRGLVSSLLFALLSDRALLVTQPAAMVPQVLYTDMFDDELFHFFATETVLRRFRRRRSKWFRRRSRKDATLPSEAPPELVVADAVAAFFTSLRNQPADLTTAFLDAVVHVTTPEPFVELLLANPHLREQLTTILRHADDDTHAAVATQLEIDDKTAGGERSAAGVKAVQQLLTEKNVVHTLVSEVLRPRENSPAADALTAM